MNNYSEVWKAVLSLIKDQVTPVCYETWFLNPLKVKKIDNRLNMIYMDVNTTMDPDLGERTSGSMVVVSERE